MIREVIIHIGLHHTGTTSFQTFLNRHKAELQSKGILVYQPINGGINGAELGAAAKLSHGMSHFISVQRNLESHIEERYANKLIVSAESLSNFGEETEISRLRSLFPRPLNFEVILVLRDQSEWIYRRQKYLRQLWHIPDEQDIDPRRVTAMWRQVIEGYRRTFYMVEVLDYQPEGMVETLCKFCGINATGLKTNFTYHETSPLKRLVGKRMPSLLYFYSKYLAPSFVGRAKRRLLNE